MKTAKMIRPEESQNIDAYMGDILRHVALDFETVLQCAPDRHGIDPGDVAVLASACVHVFAEVYGLPGVEALLRTRTLSKYCVVKEEELRRGA